ncbi:Lymphocyte-specific helicase [Smittium culicis]|uniref:Lymphocyte-specific helicase n=1 Tax=Smittium culicis TaxID=133412 RepID=A0A1R1YFF5_9FUNG|nr:Lymphocyte-specific helicase [Smittium culicis]OMJ24965.1 Lymphocyte-specific helicase [Smittium culicis]OMJ25535.1 Lymphocyte-specific helicase [Smittium culicis]
MLTFSPDSKSKPTISSSQISKNDDSEFVPTYSVKELKQKAVTEYESKISEKKKVQRLNFLLDKSSIYASFLAQKIEKQNIDKMKKLERSQRKIDKQNAALANNSPNDVQRVKTRRSKKARTNTSPPSKKTKSQKKLTDFSNNNIDVQVIDLDSNIEESQNGPEEYDLLENGQPKSIVGTMRPYQIEGMQWLISLYENGLNGILADEMGLGKTLQTIAFITFLRDQQVWGPFLIVCPLSTLGNWVSEFNRFSPSTPVVLYHGLPEERAALRKKHLNQQLSKRFPVVITTYEISMRDSKYLRHFAWKYIVVDEGQRLKNLNCQLIRELKSYQSANRLLLSGTPLQNKLSELWSLLNFLLPDIFDDLTEFQEWFDFDDINEQTGKERIINSEAQDQIISKLHHILRPFLLRRLKTEVESNLPPKREYIISCPMTSSQSNYYTAALSNDIRKFLINKMSGENVQELDPISDNFTMSGPRNAKKRAAEVIKECTSMLGDLESDNEYDFTQVNKPLPESKPVELDQTPTTNAKKRVANLNLKFRLIQLRKICNHPFIYDFPLIDPTDPESDYLINESLVRESGKLLVLDVLLKRLLDPENKQPTKDKHRILIFSQMTKMLDILAFYLNMRNYEYARIDGGVSHTDRVSQINEFNDVNSKLQLFLLSTRAGGLGINLSTADTVIIIDSDWNPQMDLQAIDRAHRIGQKKPVIVYRFVTSASVEEYILERASNKRKLEKLVIHKKHFKGISSLVNSTVSFNKSTNGQNLPNYPKANVNSLIDLGDGAGIIDLAEILSSSAAERIKSDFAEIGERISSYSLDESIPDDLFISPTDLDAITDRSPASYLNYHD